MVEEGTEVPPLDPAGVGRFVVAEIAKWRRVVAQAGIEVAP
jgi:hypothetical protein